MKKLASVLVLVAMAGAGRADDKAIVRRLQEQGVGTTLGADGSLGVRFDANTFELCPFFGRNLGRDQIRGCGWVQARRAAISIPRLAAAVLSVYTHLAEQLTPRLLRSVTDQFAGLALLPGVPSRRLPSRQCG
jgi:hypothetical protein